MVECLSTLCKALDSIPRTGREVGEKKGDDVFCLFFVVLGFEFRASHLQGILPLESLCQPFFLWSFFEIGSHKLFA
jgi:hypothetical protein